MSKDLEMKFKLNGGPAELKALADAIRGVGGASNGAGADISDLEKQIESLKDQIKQLSEAQQEHHASSEGFATDVKEFAEAPLRSANREVIHLLNGLSGMGAIVGGVAVGLGVLAVSGYELVEAQTAAAEQTEHLSIKLGLSVSQTERLGAMSKIAGTSVEGLQGAARFLSAALEDETGQGKKTADALAKLGVSTRDSSGAQREMGPVLLDVLEKLGKVQSVSERTFLAQKILPRGAAAELLPLIAHYGEFSEELEKLGLHFDDDVTQKLADGATKLNEVSLMWDKFKKALAIKIEPVVVPVLFKITQAITQMKLGREGNADNAGGLGSGANDATQNALDNKAYLDKLTKTMLDRATGQFGQSNTVLDASMGAAQKDLDAGAAKAKAFMDRYNKTAEAMKTALEAGKKKATELAADIKSAPAGSVVDRKKDEFDKQEKENNRLEGAIKKAEETKALYQKLGDMRSKAREQQKNADAELTRSNQTKTMFAGLGFAGQDAANLSGVTQLQKRFEIEQTYLKEMDKIAVEKQELVKKLGGGANAQKSADEIFGPQETEALQKRTQEFDKQVAETFKNHNTEMDKVVKDANEHSKKNMEELVKNLKEIQKVSDEEGKVIADGQKKQLEQDAAAAQAARNRQRAATQVPGSSAGFANAQEDYQAKIDLARQLSQVELDAVNQKYGKMMDELNAQQGLTNGALLNAEITKTGAQQDLEAMKIKQKLQEDMDAARIDRENQIAALEQQDLAKYHAEAGKLFDAITQKGGDGLQKFITGGLKDQGKIIFENLMAGPMKAIGGMAGNIGKSSGLGDVLAGTIFDPKKAAERVKWRLLVPIRRCKRALTP